MIRYTYSTVFTVFALVLFIACNNSTDEIEAGLLNKQNETEEVTEPNLYYGFDLDSFKVEKGVVQQNWTLSHLLLPYGVSQHQINQAAKLAEDSLNFRYISTNRDYTLLLSNDTTQKPMYCIYNRNPYELVCFDFSDSLQVKTIKKEISYEEKELSAVISEGSSLYLSIEEQLNNVGVSSQLVEEIAATYAWTIDFFKLYPNDKFKVIYEQINVEGEAVGVKKIKAVYFNHRDLDYYAFAYTPEGKQQEAFYDEKGQGMKRAFLKAPVKFSRISSSYTKRRFHPVQKRYKAHLGTDYAAPTGTPILATADGTIQAAGYTKYNGNYVKIYHNSTYQTGYLHMTNIAKGMRKGVRVKQGDVIGYVGSTGLATGPHVCYRFWKNGHQIDHRKEKFQSSDPIKKELMDTYLSDIKAIKKQIDAITFEAI